MLVRSRIYDSTVRAYSAPTLLPVYDWKRRESKYPRTAFSIEHHLDAQARVTADPSLARRAGVRLALWHNHARHPRIVANFT